MKIQADEHPDVSVGFCARGEQRKAFPFLSLCSTQLLCVAFSPKLSIWLLLGLCCSAPHIFTAHSMELTPIRQMLWHFSSREPVWRALPGLVVPLPLYVT